MAFDDLPFPHASTHAPAGTDPLTSFVDTSTSQTVGGNKTWTGAQQFNQPAIFTQATRYTPAPRTANATASSTTSYMNECDASAGAFTLTFPTGLTAGQRFEIVKVDSSANPVTIAAGVSFTTYTGSLRLFRQGDSVIIQATSTSGVYRILGGTFNPLRPAPEAIYQQITIKAGDTLVGTTAGEQAFASQPIIRANTAIAGGRYRLEVGGRYNISLNGTQRPRVRIGPSATALTSRTVATDYGALNALISTLADAYYGGYVDLVVQSVSGTSAVLRCESELEFTTSTSGQLTGFSAGPTGPGSTGSITIDPTVDNIVALTDLFGNTTANDNNTLRKLDLTHYPPSVYAA